MVEYTERTGISYASAAGAPVHGLDFPSRNSRRGARPKEKAHVKGPKIVLCWHSGSITKRGINPLPMPIEEMVPRRAPTQKVTQQPVVIGNGAALTAGR